MAITCSASSKSVAVPSGTVVDESDPQPLNFVDNVEVRDDVATRVEDDACAHTLHALRLNQAAAKRVVDIVRQRAFAVDVDYGRFDFLNDIDEAIATFRRRTGKIRRTGGTGWQLGRGKVTGGSTGG